MTINPKNIKSFILDAGDAPKFGFASNFPPRDIDSSSLARLLFVTMSDFYHFGPTDKCAEARTPKDDFGKNLFDDFDEQEWNQFLNFGTQCLKFYLGNEKIDPPMSNVNKRQMVGSMGDSFLSWAEVYFSVNSENLNVEVVREYAMQDYNKSVHSKLSAHTFGNKLREYCKYKGFLFNPKDKCNSGKRIIKQVTHEGEQGTKELFFIQTASPNTEPLPF